MSHNDITGDKIVAPRLSVIPPSEWVRKVSQPADSCTRCGGAHLLEQCKWPLVADQPAAVGQPI